MSKKFTRILSFFIFPVLILFLHFVIGPLNIYQKIYWMDSFMHFLGGFSIAYMSVLFLRFYEDEKFLLIKNGFVFILVVVSFVALVAVFWEFFEFLLKVLFDVVTQPSVKDTITDLFMGLFGGFFGAVLFRKV